MARPRTGHEVDATKTLAIRLSADMRADIDAAAAARGNGVAEEVRAAIAAHIAKWKRKEQRA